MLTLRSPIGIRYPFAPGLLLTQQTIPREGLPPPHCAEQRHTPSGIHFIPQNPVSNLQIFGARGTPHVWLGTGWYPLNMPSGSQLLFSAFNRCRRHSSCPYLGSPAQSIGIPWVSRARLWRLTLRLILTARQSPRDPDLRWGGVLPSCQRYSRSTPEEGLHYVALLVVRICGVRR